MYLVLKLYIMVAKYSSTVKMYISKNELLSVYSNNLIIDSNPSSIFVTSWIYSITTFI